MLLTSSDYENALSVLNLVYLAVEPIGAQFRAPVEEQWKHKERQDRQNRDNNEDFEPAPSNDQSDLNDCRFFTFIVVDDVDKREALVDMAAELLANLVKLDLLGSRLCDGVQIVFEH